MQQQQQQQETDESDQEWLEEAPRRTVVATRNRIACPEEAREVRLWTQLELRVNSQPAAADEVNPLDKFFCLSDDHFQRLFLGQPLDGGSDQKKSRKEHESSETMEIC